jgi:hypothetical protein
MLCQICQGFDIHDLFSLAASRPVRDEPRSITTDVFPGFEGFPEFYKHHTGLVALRSSAEEGCDLCIFIWRNWTQSLPPDAIDREWVAARKGEEQIFLGLSRWAPQLQGIPYLTVAQKIPGGHQRNLGIFEVVAERGMLSVPRLESSPPWMLGEVH